MAGDARELAEVADASVHLVVTSPPYPMIPQWDSLFASWGARDFGAMHAELARAWAACRRVLIPGGILAVNIGDALRSGPDGFRVWPNHAEVLRRAESVGFRPLPYLLWKKPTNRPNAFLGSGFLPPNAYVTLDCEFILLFRNGGLRRIPPNDPRRMLSRFTKAERDRWFSQVWEGVRGARQGDRHGRTAAFPSEVPERLIRMFSLVGDTVLDPFAGTGTTLWAARRWGRRAVGVEIDPVGAAELARRAREGPTVAGARRGGRSPRRPSASGNAAPRP
ncbi:MAG: DNA-methyltransferase [Thermoplasmata archaeon]